MNKKRLTALAEWLEGGAQHESVKFDMSTGFSRVRTDLTEPYNKRNPAHNKCTTTCCLAGSAVQFFNKPDRLFNRQFREGEADHDEYKEGIPAAVPWGTIKAEASDLLGLDWHDATALFNPDDKYNTTTLEVFSDPAWAARTIRHLIATGNVDWIATADPDNLAALEDAGYYAEEEEEETA